MNKLENIQAFIAKNDLFLAFKKQLIKDFEQANFPIDSLLTIKPNYEVLHETIMHLLRDNEFSTQHNVMQLIYRVDISETQLAKYLSENKDRNYFDVIAELIIKRVLQKVVTQHQIRNEEAS